MKSEVPGQFFVPPYINVSIKTFLYEDKNWWEKKLNIQTIIGIKNISFQ